MRFCSLSLPAGLLLLSSSLFAQGVVIVQKSAPAKDAAQASVSKVQIEGNKLFSENEINGVKHGTIFLGDAKILRIVDYGKKTYREMTQQDFEQMSAKMGSQMEDMRKMMEDKLKNLPPQQRQMVEQMMKQQMPAAAITAQKPAPVTYRKIASGVKVHQWTCDKYEGMREGQKVWEVCAVDAAELGLQPGDMQVFQQMAEMMKSMAPQGMDNFFKVGLDGKDGEGYPGVPVQRLSFRNGAPDQAFEISEVTRKDIEDAVFEVPAGFEKQSLPALGSAPPK